MNLNKHLLTFISFLILSTSIYGQITTQSADWNKIEEKSGVIFSVHREECLIAEGQKPLHYTFLKIENITSESKNLRFNFGLQFAEGCSGCNEFEENLIEMTIPANTTLIGDCSFDNVKLSRLIYNPNLADGWKFEKEVITNLTVK